MALSNQQQEVVDELKEHIQEIRSFIERSVILQSMGNGMFFYDVLQRIDSRIEDLEQS